MFAVFRTDERGKKRASDPYSSPSVAHHLCARMNKELEGTYKVRQKVREAEGERAKWQDL